MMMLLAALLVASDPAVAAEQPSAAAPVASAPAAKPAKPKKICKALDADTGSHMSKRVCKTEDEWATFSRGNGMEDLNAKGANIH